MVAPKMQHRQLRRRVPAIIQKGEQPRDLAHLLADLERRQAPEPPEEAESGDEAASQPGGAESVSSDSSKDGPSSSSSSSDSSVSQPEPGQPKPSSTPTAGLPGQSTTTPPAVSAPSGRPNSQGAVLVPVPGMNPTTLSTSTTRAASSTETASPTSGSPSSATSQTLSLSSSIVLSPSQPVLNLPLPVPSASRGLVSGGVAATSVVSTGSLPSATSDPATVEGSLNLEGAPSAVAAGANAAGILAGSIAGIACVTGAAIYLYRRHKRTREMEELESNAEFSEKPSDGRSTESRNPLWRSFFSSSNTNSVDARSSAGNAGLGVPNNGFGVESSEAQLERMTALDAKQYAAYKNLMGAGK